MPSKKKILSEFTLRELQAAAQEFEVEVVDRRFRHDLVEGLASSKRAKRSKLLEGFTRARLLELCTALGVRAEGRNRADFINALDPKLRGTKDDVDVASVLKKLLPENTDFVDESSTWPVRLALTFGDDRLLADIYIRGVGSSSRGKPQERRFQNPSKRHPIRAPKNGAYLLLLGLWLEQGVDRAVLIAFDGYRRIDKETRFSLFMPVTLPEKAADTGFASHASSTGENIYAFRPDNFGRYLDILAEDPTWGEHRPKVVRTGAAETQSETYDVPKQLAPAETDKIYIRPRVGMYSAFARLNYKPWFALAEFVDNSIQSLLNTQELLAAEEPLRVDISIDDEEISVTDRAGGIAFADFPRAFSPAAPPDDPSGLSEFGLGMKAAACWFSRYWTVRTSALGEDRERTVTFDVPKIAREGLEDLPIETRSASAKDHYTVVSMRSLRVRPRGQTLRKVKDHLASIYRVLMAEGLVQIRLTTGTNTQLLEFSRPELLTAPYYKTPKAEEKPWEKRIGFELEDGRKVSGWAGVLAKGSFVHAGLSVFRRRRLVQGSAGETYKPKSIFGNPNSYASQRVIGELHVEGFDVTHTKDGIQWGGAEEEVIEKLRAQMNDTHLPLLDQANGYRVRKSATSLKPGYGADAVQATADAFAQPVASEALKSKSPSLESDIDVEDASDSTDAPLDILVERRRRVHVPARTNPLDVVISLVRDEGGPWYAVHMARGDSADEVNVRLNLDHPFSNCYLNEDEASLRPLVPLVSGFALAEIMASDSGVKGATQIRRNVNELLKRVLSESTEV